MRGKNFRRKCDAWSSSDIHASGKYPLNEKDDDLDIDVEHPDSVSLICAFCN